MKLFDICLKFSIFSNHEIIQNNISIYGFEQMINKNFGRSKENKVKIIWRASLCFNEKCHNDVKSNTKIPIWFFVRIKKYKIESHRSTPSFATGEYDRVNFEKVQKTHVLYWSGPWKLKSKNQA